MKKDYINGNYPVNSAGKKMTTEFLMAKKSQAVGTVLSKLRKEIKNIKTTDYVYIVDKSDNLIGAVSIKDIIVSHQNTRIGDIIKKTLVSVSPETDQVKVADLAIKHNLRAIPVVEGKRLIGVIPIDEIFSILNKTLKEDILHLAGIHKSHLKYDNTLALPLFLSILHRLPWLIIGLIGISVAAIFIGIFEATLQNYLILAFFIPAIVYMSDALGTQHQILFVRDLALLGRELNIKKYFFRQMIIGAILGLILSSVIFLIISLFWKQVFIALVIAISMFVTLIVSSFTALSITFIISKLGIDPALGSSPFATVVSDLISIIIYFGVAFLLLGF